LVTPAICAMLDVNALFTAGSLMNDAASVTFNKMLPATRKGIGVVVVEVIIAFVVDNFAPQEVALLPS